MKKIPWILLMIIPFSCIPAQKKLVLNGYAYFQKISHGTVQVEEGLAIKQNDTARYVYLETADTNQPVIDSIIYKGIKYDMLLLSPAEKLPVKAGEKETARKGYRLWQINLSGENHSAIFFPDLRNKIVIKGKLNNRPFTCILKKETELSLLLAE